MDQKINKMLNIYEVSSIFCVVLSLGILAITHSINSILYYKEFLTIMAIVSEVVIVSIELLLFYLVNLRNKVYTIGFYILELFFIIYMNIKVPFIGLLLLLVFCIIKGIYRILCVDSIYVPNKLYRLCKMYGIKIKRSYKKKTITINEPIKSKKTKKVKRNAEVSESYA